MGLSLGLSHYSQANADALLSRDVRKAPLKLNLIVRFTLWQIQTNLITKQFARLAVTAKRMRGHGDDLKREHPDLQ